MIDVSEEEGDERKMSLAAPGRERARAPRQILKMRKMYLQQKRLLKSIKNESEGK